MSTRIAAFLVVGFVVAAGSTLFAFKKMPASAPAPVPVEIGKTSGTASPAPWIEVVHARAVEYDGRDGGDSRILETGDEVGLGNMIETDTFGIANIYFPDGSVLRLDANTKIVLDEAKLDSENQGLSARIFLASGRVWSKVLALLTPGSLWEVKTSNAVATVRGTAFGMAIAKGKTSIIGAEHAVAVQAIDPETRRPVGNEVVVDPDRLVEIAEKDIALIKESKKKLAVEKVPAKILTDPWIRSAKNEDRKYDEKIEQLKARGDEAKKLRDELRTKIRKELKIEEQSEKPISEGSEHKNNVSVPERIEIIKENRTEKETLPAPVPVPEPKPTEQASIVPQRAAELVIRANADLKNVLEGDRIQFKAILTGPDGQTRDATADVRWTVIGSIGRMASPGIFIAELGPDVSEFGEARGTVTAIWRNSKTGEAMLAKSPIFRVEAKVEDSLNTDG